MAERDVDLQFLLELAVDKSIEARHRLSAQMGELASPRAVPLSDQERDLITEILNKLLRQFEQPIRLELSERLAGKAEAPRDLVLALANDQIDVARPILTSSSLLQDPELIEIIRHRGQQHRVAIARRRQLSEQVTEVLVETDDEDVIKTLLENDNAPISQATMAYLVEESRRVDSFQEPLVQRKDLDPALSRKLYWWVAAALRSQISENFSVHAVELDHELEDTVHKIAAIEANAAAETPAAQLARQLSDADRITAALLINALRQGEIALFEALFGELSGLEAPRLQRVLYQTGGESLAIACRAVGLSKQDFAAIFMLSRVNGSMVDPQELLRATTIFDAVSDRDAEHVLETWRRDPEFLDAIEQLEDSTYRQKPEARAWN